MAQYILNILRAQLSIVWSWGFNSPMALENGLIFKVQGFKFKGMVKIEYNEGKDLFDVFLIKKNQIHEKIEDVYLEELVRVIDNHVEKVADYDKKVKETYSLI